MDLQADNLDSDALEAYKVLKDRTFNKDILDRLSSESLTQLIEFEESNDSTIFHFISENFSDIHKYFFNICKRKLTEETICEIFLKKDKNDRMPFELTAKKISFCNFITSRLSRKSVELLFSAFCSEPITQFIDKHRNNFVHHLAKNYYNSAIVNALIEFCRRGENLNHLENALETQNSSWGNTPIHILIEKSSHARVFEVILETFGGKIFSIKDKWGCNVFDRISFWSQSRNKYAFENILMKFYEKNISSPEIREAFVSAMMQGDNIKRIPVHAYVVHRKPRLFLSMCNILTDDEVKKVFLMEDDEGRNIFKLLFYFYFIEPRPDDEIENDQEMFDAVLGTCQKHSSWIKDIFAEGTELNKTLVYEEKDRCHFARCLRKVMES